MSLSFLDRLYEEVYEWLGDPSSSKRLSKGQILRDFTAVENELWERTLNACGQESLINKVTANITVVEDQSRYPLPGGFRQFLHFEKPNEDDPDICEGKLRSISFTNPGPGVEIINANQGMIIRPTPDSTMAGTWNLEYLKGPILVHNAKAALVTENSITFSDPDSPDDGELIKIDNYYCGSVVKVYSANSGAPQTNVINSFNADSLTAQMQFAWSVIPMGNVRYEISPTQPYAEVYSVRVASKQAKRRGMVDRRHELDDEFDSRIWPAVKNWWLSNVADRGPERMDYFDEDYIDVYRGAS